MKYSDDFVALVKNFEGCRLEAYPDAEGFSIGYGHFGAIEGETISQVQADELLASDLLTAEDAVSLWTKERQLKQGQFDALCDFVYNLGVKTFYNSRVLFYVLHGDDAQAMEHLKLYVYSKGRYIPELAKRRQAEIDLYNKE